MEQTQTTDKRLYSRNAIAYVIATTNLLTGSYGNTRQIMASKNYGFTTPNKKNGLSK